MTSFEKSAIWFILWAFFIAGMYALYLYDKHLDRVDNCQSQTVKTSGVLL